jgi:site-specific recombinase XerD
MESIEPSEAVTLYLEHKQTDATPSTVQSHEYRLNAFLRWCDEKGIYDMNELTGRDIHQYRVWRRKDGDLSPASEKTQMDTIRVFIRYCEQIEAVPDDLSESVQSPQLSKQQASRDEKLTADTVEQILDRQHKYRYAQRYHIVPLLAWRTAMRTSGIRSLDLKDVDREEMCLHVRNRPPETRLKQGSEGERIVGIREDTLSIIDDYIDHHRDSVEIGSGREPLITTTNGRVASNTIRRIIYKVTRPCMFGQDCPHDRDKNECEATNHPKAASCPSSVSPHVLRRSAITHWLNQDWPTRAVADRASVSAEVLKKHYDARDEMSKMQTRRQYLD